MGQEGFPAAEPLILLSGTPPPLPHGSWGGERETPPGSRAALG